jgi:hypothetical protein
MLHVNFLTWQTPFPVSYIGPTDETTFHLQYELFTTLVFSFRDDFFDFFCII